MWVLVPGYRASCVSNCLRIPSQVRQHTQLQGLAHFARDIKQELWQPQRWRDWPSLLLGGDLGSDNVASDSALLYEYKLNMIRFPDPSHGAWRSVQGTLRDICLHGFWVLLVVSCNTDNGPDNSDGWFHSHKACMEWMYGHHLPSTSPLFQEVSPDIVDKLKEQGVSLDDGFADSVVWQHLRVRSETRALMPKCNMIRFRSDRFAVCENWF